MYKRQRKPSFIPPLKDKEWAMEMLKQWKEDSETPKSVKNAIVVQERRN